MQRTTTPTRQSNEAKLGTAIGQTAFACYTFVIVYSRLDSDLVAFLKIFDAFANLIDHSAEFMT